MEKETITITEAELTSAASVATSKIISKMIDISGDKSCAESILATVLIAGLLAGEMHTILFSGGANDEVKA